MMNQQQYAYETNRCQTIYPALIFADFAIPNRHHQNREMPTIDYHPRGISNPPLILFVQFYYQTFALKLWLHLVADLSNSEFL